MAELKPCPFCGGTAHTVGFKHGAEIYFVICGDCGAEMARRNGDEYIGDVDLFFDSEFVKNATIEAWNRRAEDEHKI